MSRSSTIPPVRAIVAGAAIAAVIAGLAVAPAAAGPAPASTVPAPATTSAWVGTNKLPTVWPTPQHIWALPGRVAIPKVVIEVAGARTDKPAISLTTTVLRRAGATDIRRVTSPPTHPRPGTLTVFVGGPNESRSSMAELRRLRMREPGGLPAGGYVLVAHQHEIVLAGADGAGSFYAAETLRQLIQGPRGHASLHSVLVLDWPANPLRGVIEGFYGPPWSTADRLSQLDFYASTKQNIYVYSPKDDPYLRAQWRDPYPPAQLAVLERLVTRATSDHVAFTYALSPGLSVCYSSKSDEQALVKKFQSLYDIGVRSFAIPLDDISYTTWNCAADQKKFGTGGAAAGNAQSYLLNEVQKGFIATHPGVARLQMVPTEYTGSAPSPYKNTIRRQLDKEIIVEWTGPQVVSPTITTAELAATKRVYGHDILIWDNYPVNDYVTDRLLLGPYVGRQPGVVRDSAGLTANPMIEAAPSKIAEFTSGDFAWNPSNYDPKAAWLAAVHAEGGDVWRALEIFAENNYSSVIDSTESPTLSRLIAALRAAQANHRPIDRPARAVGAYFAEMARVPQILRAGMLDRAFVTESGPWLTKLGMYGQAGQVAVRLLLADQRGDAKAVAKLRAQLQADRKRLDAIPQQVSPGVADKFLYQTLLETAPPTGPQVAVAPAAVSLEPGTSARVTVTVTSHAKASVHWRASAAAGVSVAPAAGILTVPPRGSAHVRVTVRARGSATPGTRSVVVSGTSGGAAIVDRALPVQVTAGRGDLRALVADYSEPTVTPVDTDKATAGTAIKVGTNPGDIVISPDGRTAYTANQGSNTVSIIDVARGKEVATIPVGHVPAGLALTPDGATLWVANYSDDTVQPVDTATRKAGATIAVGHGPEDLAITPDGSALYVADSLDNAVTRVDLRSRTAGTPIAVGSSPFDVVAAPDGRTVYVSNSGGSTVTPIDTATAKAEPTFLVSGQAYGLGISPDGRTLWVTDSKSDTATPVDTVTGAPGRVVTVGNDASDIALSWNGAHAYVACSGDNTLVPITVATSKAAKPIPTGSYPIAVATTPVPVR